MVTIKLKNAFYFSFSVCAVYAYKRSAKLKAKRSRQQKTLPSFIAISRLATFDHPHRTVTRAKHLEWTSNTDTICIILFTAADDALEAEIQLW